MITVLFFLIAHSSSLPFSSFVGFLLIIYQVFIYEKVMKNLCSNEHPGPTFFGLLCVSSCALLLLPVGVQCVGSYYGVNYGYAGGDSSVSSSAYSSYVGGSGDVSLSLNHALTYDVNNLNYMNNININSKSMNDVINGRDGDANKLYSIRSTDRSNTDPLARDSADNTGTAADPGAAYIVDANHYVIGDTNANTDDSTGSSGSHNGKTSSSSSSSSSSSNDHKNYNAQNKRNLSDKSSNNSYLWSLHITIVLCLSVYRSQATSAFNTVGILVNGSVDRHMRGTLNGVIMTCGSLGNAVGPVLGALLYATAEKLPRPLDGRIVFPVGAIFMMCIAVTAKIWLKK